MATKTFMRGVHRCSRHTCDVCGMQVTVKGIKPPPGWTDLGVIGVQGILCCIDCGTDVAEHVAEWLLQRAEGLQQEQREPSAAQPSVPSTSAP